MAATSTSGAAGPDAGPAASPDAPQQEGLSERQLAKVFLAPAIGLMLLLGLGPILYALFESLFTHPTIVDRGEFAGIDAYVDLLTDGRFWGAVWTTLSFTAVSVAMEFVLGLAFALLMNAAIKGRGIVRATILLPWVIPTAIAGQIWLYLFQINPGYINQWLVLGNFDWLGGGQSMFWAVVLADVWKTAPFVGLLLLAGLQTIPGDLYEAARVDGATWAQRFRKVTLPLLKPAIVVALLFRSVDALRMFDLSDIMTEGRVETLSVLTQRRIFTAPAADEANALSALTFVIIMGLGLVFIMWRRRDILGEDQ
ncbi:sugar ABC transporter permease [Egibacter rhizosphaerae]|uniref:Sugar ABC transporter permease n=1 Tax=Egibacter rhizosphaerae TaxID=1670831 RepID=A0A411YIA9_9ACTN|nr:sugar ABC transporter permease [Egibacter rhizosphaerae]QBI21024.1 sugar ABC transporter permease [Egibacter rhizosphaerae]